MFALLAGWRASLANPTAFRRDRRGTVAILSAMVLPVSLGVVALCIDVSNWELTRIRLQGIADIAAMAGAARYAQTWDGPAAVTTAANVAELNGAPAGTRSGVGTNTVTDEYGDWNMRFSIDTSGSAPSVTARVQTTAPVWFGHVHLGVSKEALSATAVAVVNLTSTGGQACILALKGDTDGITTYNDISISGNTSITSQTCGVRSDGSLSISGNATIGVPSVTASGTISVSGNSTIDCPTSSPCSQAEIAQIPDPFYSTYYGDLSIPNDVGTGSHSGSTYNPGEYSDLSFSGNGSYTLNPGVYYVTGQISISGTVALTGNGVTLISIGGLSMSGNGRITLTAPSSGETAGLLYGTSGSGSISLSGNSNVVLSGAVYAPNATVTITGNSSSYTTQSSCLNVVASTASFSGNSDFTNAGCAALGVPALYNKPATAMLSQ